MSAIDKYTKDQERGRKDYEKFNRPRFFSHDDDGENYLVPRQLHGDKTARLSSHLGRNATSVEGKYLSDPWRSLGGLTGSYVDRLFEYERTQWPRSGFISPYKNDRGREERDANEFTLWLYWHPHGEKVLKRMDEEYCQGYDSPYYGIDDLRRRSGLPVGTGTHRHHQQRDRQRRGPGTFNRPAYRRSGPIDHQDPRYRPPDPVCDMMVVREATNRSPNNHPAVHRRQQNQRHPVVGRSREARDATHPRHLAHRNPSRRAQPQLSQRPLGAPRRSWPSLDTQSIFADHDPREEGRAAYHYGLHPHQHHPLRDRYEYGDEHDEFDDENSSHCSSTSYIRERLRSPNIVPASLPPYTARAGRHSRHNDRYNYDANFGTDGDDDDDEPFHRRRGGRTGRRSGLYEIRREGPRVRVGPRGYEREGWELGFGDGDEEDGY